MKTQTLFFAFVLLAGCGKNDAGNGIANAPASEAPNAPQPPSRSTDAMPPTQPAEPEHNILAEPKASIDPESVEAAGQVVQHYGALVEQGRFSEARLLWRDPAAASQFAKELMPATHMELGELGETEGAAGSIYTTVPVTFYRTGFRRRADIILRRVNDVPGSTEAQRRWHIDQIEWKAAP